MKKTTYLDWTSKRKQVKYDFLTNEELDLVYEAVQDESHEDLVWEVINRLTKEELKEIVKNMRD